MSHGTPSTSVSEIDGAYMHFVAKVVQQLPRPKDMDFVTTHGWTQNGAALHRALSRALLPQPDGPLMREFKSVYVNGAENFNAHEAYRAFPFRRIPDNVSSFMRSRLRFMELELEQMMPFRPVEVPPGNVRIQRINTSCGILEAFQALGDRNTCEWSDVFELLQLQKNGEPGVLVRSSVAMNFFPIYCDGIKFICIKWESKEKTWELRLMHLGAPQHVYKNSRIFVR